MGKRGTQGIGSEAGIKSFIANIIANRPDEIRSKRGKISSTIIARLFHEETGEKVTRQTVAKYIADKDFINHTQVTIPESNTRMEEINKRIAIAKNIADNENAKDGDRCKALNTFGSLTKIKIDYEEKLLANKLRQADVKRPVHLIVACEPPAVVTCPKCEHNFLVDNSKADEKHLKDWLKNYKHNLLDSAKKDWDKIKTTIQPAKKGFKAGNGQDTLDGSKKNADD